ncbi:hypothetical protein HUT19_02775 [Streptomyces sp. NA02950]|uniref:hypothetical protein n=1 Tax=Streptomyces sp. NA02950 TaxID=2742137 RepID=UPI0015920A4A|nr:hypothetical protein [Streptomyces sp. NA02950]QKV90795.1 hypothetical protein HUT19_02775 [Streptomyces sp. NA02950]
MLFKRFRRKPTEEPLTSPPAPEHEDARWMPEPDGPDSEGMITLPGTGWTGEWWREMPVRVPWRVDVSEFLSRRPLPYLWPDDPEYRAHVDGGEHPEQLLHISWTDVFLHHPDDSVVIQCLRDAFTGDNVGNLTSVADLLGHTCAPEVKQEAAKAVWRLSDEGVHRVFNVLLSRGFFPSDYAALCVHEALGHLRAMCPPERAGTLASELGGPDQD